MIMKIVSPKGKYKDDNIYQDMANYCFNPEKCKSGLIVTRNLNQATAARDMQELTERMGKARGTRVRQTVIAFEDSDNATPETAYQIAKAACDFFGKDYQIYGVVHQGHDNPHIHTVMNTVHKDTGKKYGGKKDEYFAFKDYMRKTAREYGMKFRTDY